MAMRSKDSWRVATVCLSCQATANKAPDAVVDARFRALNAEPLKKKFGSDGVFFNGPRRFVANDSSGIGDDNCKPRVMDAIPFVPYGTLTVPSSDKLVPGPPVAYKVLISNPPNTIVLDQLEGRYQYNPGAK
jgi:hypothetical protein